jgi:hypothetical protein
VLDEAVEFSVREFLSPSDELFLIRSSSNLKKMQGNKIFRPCILTPLSSALESVAITPLQQQTTASGMDWIRAASRAAPRFLSMQLSLALFKTFTDLLGLYS